MGSSRKIQGLILAGCLAFASVTGVIITVQPAFGAASFTDVPSDYWGLSYITFAAEKGIIDGYPQPDGTHTFAPENAVTMEEAVAMLYRALDAAGKLQSKEDFQNEYAQLFDEHKVAGWARSYVAYGLKYGIVEESEIRQFTDEAGVGTSALRIKTAVWTAKAMEKEFIGAYGFPYTDAASISAETMPYVDLLYRHGIMKGSLQVDGSLAFMPDAGVKRSEFAAISNRVFESAQSEDYDISKETVSYRGTITKVDAGANQITLRSASAADGTSTEKVITIYSSAQIAYNGEIVYNKLNAVSAGQIVVISSMTTGDISAVQVQLLTDAKVREGVIAEVRALTGALTQIGIKDSAGNTIYYIKDQNTKSDTDISKDKEIKFIADGVKLLEII